MRMKFESDSATKLATAYEIVNNANSIASGKIQEASKKLLDKLNEELYNLEHNEAGKVRTPTPKEKERIAQIYDQIELIKTANTGLAAPASWGQFFRDQQDRMRSAVSPRNIAGNTLAFVAAVGVAFAVNLALVAMTITPIGGPLLVLGACFFLSFKICAAIRRAYNDSPGARMDAAAQKAGLNAGPTMSPSGATPSVVVNNIQGENTTHNNSDPTSNRRYGFR